ncbi:hypothetical protein DPEC_G00345560 [Dallia pectoralis]|uniref:Uncharacterized protein n=1 Tax=Dallia pectoralis TaxID=75939 RepID=A0ACC2F3N9_DALPE|nr:hypothetical protein DPEC_G00345560 [Dallia pectoralis]
MNKTPQVTESSVGTNVIIADAVSLPPIHHRRTPDSHRTRPLTEGARGSFSKATSIALSREWDAGKGTKDNGMRKISSSSEHKSMFEAFV